MPSPSGFEVNVPARALQELARVAGHVEDEQLRISVRLCQNQVLFEPEGSSCPRG